jgi:hypothetical protein
MVTYTDVLYNNPVSYNNDKQLLSIGIESIFFIVVVSLVGNDSAAAEGIHVFIFRLEEHGNDCSVVLCWRKYRKCSN